MNKYCVSKKDVILKAIEIIDKGGIGIAIVVDAEFRVIGTVTDGDIRRGLLAGVGLEDKIDKVMNRNCTTANAGMSWEIMENIAAQKLIQQIPIVDDKGTLIGIETFRQSSKQLSKDNWVILMAGGLGTRLRPMTEKTPKPMLKIGGKPILEIIIENCTRHGLRKFIICVNYLSDVVRGYFGDGSDLGVEIIYVKEEKKLGTAGALSLLENRPSTDFIVMNGDVLTTINFDQLIEYHEKEDAIATMCVKEYDFKVPYGVIQTDQNRIVGIEEKPVHRFFINAGIYILNPKVLDSIEKNEYLDMPSLFEDLVDKDKKAVTFPIREYWLDIGKPEDFQRATDIWGDEFE